MYKAMKTLFIASVVVAYLFERHAVLIGGYLVQAVRNSTATFYVESSQEMSEWSAKNRRKKC